MRRLFVLLAGLAVVAALWAPAGVRAQETGVVEGRVVNATPDGPPIGAIPLTLRTFRRMTQESETLGRTDAQGRFRFEGLEVHPDIRYFVQAGYQNVAYRSRAIDLVREPGPVEVSVWETTTADAGIFIRRASIAVPESQPQQGFVTFLEVVTVVNESGRTFVGSLFTDPQAGGSVRLPLPDGVVNVSLGHGFEPDGARAAPGGMIGLAPLPPGEQELVFTYAVPYTETALTLRRLYAYRVDSVQVVLPASGPRAASASLELVGPVDIEGRPHVLLTGGRIAPGDVLALRLSELPRFVSLRDGGPSLDTALRGAVVGAMAVALATALSYAIVVRRRRHPGLPGYVGISLAGLDALERERHELVAALAELEDRRETDRVGQPDYERLRFRQRGRLTDVLMLIREQTGEGVA